MWPVIQGYLSSWSITFLVRKSIQFIKLETRILFCEERDLGSLRDISVLAGELSFFTQDISSERSRTQFSKICLVFCTEYYHKTFTEYFNISQVLEFFWLYGHDKNIKTTLCHGLLISALLHQRNYWTPCQFLGDATFEPEPCQ